ncbi:8-oxoguanine DNA glycosylase OGG fold protein [Streptomyces sp. NBC_00443]|uniref:8-oxoguanine DNA glycosylase OGG fold protein n=1 Tax=Streptomyces sp. NBC_00443 TaxID=2975743 RepID=UPI002E244A1B
MSRQDQADAVDREMAARLLPDTVLRALGRWWGESAARLADGTPGGHTVRYSPSRWAQITPWPSALASTSQVGDAGISRAGVVSIVSDALRREAYREALVATYVWGKGKSGSPGGSGPATLHKILAAEGLDAALARAVTELSVYGAEAAYAELRGRIPWLGPSFYTKFLYFVGKTLPPATGPAPLVLDAVLARRLRSLARAVGRETGYDPDGSVACWVWRDWHWSSHRYAVYLAFMHAVAHQLAATDTWPSDASPDLLEYALFSACGREGSAGCQPYSSTSHGYPAHPAIGRSQGRIPIVRPASPVPRRRFDGWATHPICALAPHAIACLDQRAVRHTRSESL